ncbi:type IIG restriction enzyme/methyltransferase [Polaribacter sp. L3A8]|uniref:type IIG restriction enzyme/methyltransferase n=1 Tax=Polaribacter sp. L3A8 TaxID=2686361 RepID=UPI00131DB4B6|nr:TaqI-like C-terminal specificity domain-containing protein [Polaribacter sp. L3A8]
MNKTNTRKALNPAYRKHKPLRKDVTNFIVQLQDCINAVKLSDDNGESEEHIKSHFTTFFNTTFYTNNYINTKDRIDLAIYLEDKPTSDIGVIIEAKKPSNKAEFLREDNLNRKALQELLLYYLRERLDNNNNNIKHLIATNGYEWYLFKSEDFYNYFFKNKALIKEYKDFRDGLKDTTKNELFYNEIAKKYIAEIEQDLPFVHLDFTKTNLSKLKDGNLNTLYKIFSDVHILGHPFGNDSNQLNKTFYNELLHIIGLEEVKDKGKKIINRKEVKDRDYASLLENTIFHLEDRDYLSNIKSIPNGVDKPFNAGLELCLTWVNRILFLKLLESQLLTYHQNDEKYKFLNAKFINGFDDLNDLFFSALAKQEDQRHPKYKDKYKDIPYLNSSLFERNTLEEEAFEISALNNDEIAIYSGTVLKDANGKKQKGKLTTLEYLFKFLDAYNFATDGTEGIEDEKETKSLINASVLGLIFEKINGYKEGSFYTPAYITMYMCRETIRRTVIQKFKEQEETTIETFEDLQSYCSRLFKVDDLQRLNNIVNSIKICDPAVGSGHFLVSALNELIVIKNELKILTDAKGMPLRCDIEIVNDELYVIDDKGALFEYNPTDKESARVQHTLFHEKQTLIENCLFGVDINPNSVKICRLRLWIELLKNAYYTPKNRLQTLPNIDINIKCGNSLISRFKLDDDLKEAFKNKDLNYTFTDYKNAVTEYKETNSKERKREVLKIINEVKNNFKSTLDKSFLVNFEKAQGKLINEQERQNNLKTFGEKIKKTEKDELKKLKIKAEKAYLEKEEIVNNAIYHNAFEWRFEFPEVLSDEGAYVGFDTIIGNPPYLDMREISKKQVEYLKLNFKTASNRVNLFSLFIEKFYNISNQKAKSSFIVPRNLIRSNEYLLIREFILNKTSIKELLSFKLGVFEDVTSEVVILILDKVISDINDIEIYNFVKYIDKNVKPKSIKQSVFKESIGKRFNIYLNENKISLLKKIKNQCINLGSISETLQGIIAGNEKKFISKEKKNEIYKPILRGKNIDKYYTPKSAIEYIEYIDGTKHLTRSRKRENFEVEEKIITQHISGKIKGTIDYSGFYYMQTINGTIINNNKYKIEYILSLMNSKLMDFYYDNTFNLGAEFTTAVAIHNIDLLPIKDSVNESQDKLAFLVNEILSLKKENPEADTSSLEKEIDQMVYKLYGLTEEEIAIVENS